jgi:hypothetical protein
MSALTFKTFIGTTQDLNKALYYIVAGLYYTQLLFEGYIGESLNGTRLLPKFFWLYCEVLLTRDRYSQVIIIRYNVPIVFAWLFKPATV